MQSENFQAPIEQADNFQAPIASAIYTNFTILSTQYEMNTFQKLFIFFFKTTLNLMLVAHDEKKLYDKVSGSIFVTLQVLTQGETVKFKLENNIAIQYALLAPF